MTRESLAKVLGGLALMGPLTVPAWAEEKPGQADVQIYTTDQVVKQVAQNKLTPEQSKPITTETGAPAPVPMNGQAVNGQAVNGEACVAEEAPGALQSQLACSPLGSWLECNRVKVSGHVAQGYTWNPDSPHDRQNFGRLFDDRSNDYRFNQAVLTFERALEAQPCESDWGFKVQLMYGSDARFIHNLGFMDNITNDTVQPDIVEAYVSYHTPILTPGGVDIKVGQFVTLHGYEVIHAPTNPLYSHSYMFNFGIPFKHTGVLTTTHVTDQLDVHLGLVAGINTATFDDNNDVWAFHGGINWHNCAETVAIAAALHSGPENDGFFNTFGIDSNDDFRHIFDVVTTLTLSECLTAVTDVNIGKDEGFDAEWYGVSQYLIYKLNPCMSAVARLEIWRDDDAFAAAQFASNDDFVDLQRGELSGLDARTVGGGDTTYTALTFGLNVKPYENLLVRPEMRWDWANSGSQGVAPYDDSSDNNQFTLGMDVILMF